MPKIFALIPAYNEEKNIEKVLKKIKNLKIETIVVDDCSKDKTYEIAKRYAKFVLKHEKNKGKAEAIKTGLKFMFENLSFDIVTLIDADNAYDPLEIPKFVEKIKKGYDFVMGFRNWKDVPFRHKLGNFIWRKTFNMLFGTKFLDTNCGFVAMNKKAAEKLKDLIYGGYILENAMLIEMIKENFRIGQINVKVNYESKRDFLSGIRMVLGVLLFILVKGICFNIEKFFKMVEKFKNKGR
jgi:glycosyltransferase involved in cell wall biosynthesis